MGRAGHATGRMDGIGRVLAGFGMDVSALVREKNAAKHPDPERDLFLLALGEYLKGNWYEAESVCQQLLRDKARDAEAELMLATILRHTGRYAAARERLDDLKRWDDAAKWEWEIANELERLAEAEQQEPDDPELQAAPTSTPLLEAA